MSNYTIEDTSPLWRWHPYGDGHVDGGWASFYSISGFNNQGGEASEGDSLHLTSFENASVNLTFVGSSITVFGTANCSYEVVVDNATPATITSPPSPSTLYSLPSLSNATHTISLTAHPSTGSTQTLGVDKAVITVPFDANATTPTAVDNSNTSCISYQPPGEWVVPKIDPQIPSMADPKPYHLTRTAHAFASLNWTGGDAVAIRGVSNYGSWTYTVTLDGVTSLYNASSWWLVPDALLFFQPFSASNSSTPHSLMITNAADDMMTVLNSVTLYGNVSQLAATSNTTSSVPSNTTSPAPSNTSPSHVNVGVIVGPIVAVLAVLGLLGLLFLRRRRSRHRGLAKVAIETVTPYDQIDRGQLGSQVLETGHDSLNDPQAREQNSGISRSPPIGGTTTDITNPLTGSSSFPLPSANRPLSTLPGGEGRSQGAKRGMMTRSNAHLDTPSQDNVRPPPPSQTVDMNRIMDMFVQRLNLSPTVRRPEAGGDELPPSYGEQ